MSAHPLSRRSFVKGVPMVGAILLAACAAPAPTPTAQPKPAAPPPTTAPAPAPTTAPAAAPTTAPAAAATTAPTAAAAAAPTTVPAAAKPASGTPVTIRVNYRIGDKPEVFEKAWPKFMQENPNIKIVGEPISFGAYDEYFAKLASMMAADNLGDVVWVSAGSGPFMSQVFKGFFRPLDDLIASTKYDLNVFYAGAMEGLKYEGKLYALPSDFHPGNQLMVYNKKLFDAAGVKYPTDDWTFDQFNEIAAKLTKRSGDKVEVFGYAPNLQAPSYEILVRANGGSTISADAKKSAVKDDPAKTAFQWLFDSMYTHKFATRKQDQPKGGDELFYAEQAAIVTSGTGIVFNGPTRIGGKFQMGGVRTPVGKGGKHGGMIHIGGTAIYAKTKFPDEAFKVNAMLTGTENALTRALEYGGYIPRKDLFESPIVREKGGQPWQVVLDASADPNLKPYFTPYNFRTSEMQSVIDQTTDGWWTGNKTFDAGLDELDTALNVVLAKPR
jgi:multiple sugar transport system substrate-binding protein